LRLEFSPDGRALRTLSGETACVWDPSSGAEVDRISVRAKPRDFLAIDLRGKVGLARKGAELELRRLDSQAVVRAWPHGLANPITGTFSADGKVLMLLTATREELTAVMVDAGTGNEISRFPQSNQPRSNFTLSPGGKYLAWRDEKGSVCLGETGTGKIV